MESWVVEWNPAQGFKSKSYIAFKILYSVHLLLLTNQLLRIYPGLQRLSQAVMILDRQDTLQYTSEYRSLPAHQWVQPGEKDLIFREHLQKYAVENSTSKKS